ncbi:hypothetical protein D3C71_2186830 [compost metagenome]
MHVLTVGPARSNDARCSASLVLPEVHVLVLGEQIRRQDAAPGFERDFFLYIVQTFDA